MSTHAAPLPHLGAATEPRPITRTLQLLSMTPDQVEGIELPLIRRGHRYAHDQVDALLSTVAEAMRRGHRNTFVSRPGTAGMFKPGYPADVVDRLLKRLRAQGALTF